jgi:predicted lysophospholipase L1 biosynthesis ABC-type transport system permease subunit
MGMSAGEDDPKISGIYHPLTDSSAFPIHVAIHVTGDPEAFAPRLRTIITAIDPALRLYSPQRLDKVDTAERQFLAFWFKLTVMVSAIALLLSLAGIYSVMSFTVSRRTREIGIRVALGSDPRGVVAAIFRRPLTQVAFGIVAGGALVTAFAGVAESGDLSPKHVALIVAYSALMLAVCMLACIVPTRRALRVEPTEALRGDG